MESICQTSGKTLAAMSFVPQSARGYLESSMSMAFVRRTWQLSDQSYPSERIELTATAFKLI
jgi:hypothetical protein